MCKMQFALENVVSLLSCIYMESSFKYIHKILNLLVFISEPELKKEELEKLLVQLMVDRVLVRFWSSRLPVFSLITIPKSTLC